MVGHGLPFGAMAGRGGLASEVCFGIAWQICIQNHMCLETSCIGRNTVAGKGPRTNFLKNSEPRSKTQHIFAILPPPLPSTSSATTFATSSSTLSPHLFTHPFSPPSSINPSPHTLSPTSSFTPCSHPSPHLFIQPFP